MMTGILLGTSFAILYGLQLVAFRKSLEQTKASVCYIFYTIFGLIFWIPLSLFLGINFENIGEVLFVTLISAILSEAYVTYALSKGSLSVASAIFSTYPAATVLFAHLLLGEHLSTSDAVAVSVTILGIITVSFPTVNTLTKATFGGILFPLSASLAVGFSDTISKGVLNRSDLATFLFALALSQVPVSIIYHRIETGHYRMFRDLPLNLRQHRPLYFSAASYALILILFWLAYNSTYASIAAPVTGSYVVFTVLFAALFLKERITPKEYLGIGLITVGVLGLSV